MNNWKTSLAIIPFLAIAFLLYTRTITVEHAVILLPVVGSYLAFAAKDGDSGSTKPSAVVDRAVERVHECLPEVSK